MYARGLIVMLVLVALAGIFPSEIEACPKPPSPERILYPSWDVCNKGGGGRFSCCEWCAHKQGGRPSICTCKLEDIRKNTFMCYCFYH